MSRIIFAALLSITINSYGQNFVIDWEKTFGGSNIDEASTVVTTGDGGYFVSGYTTSQFSGNIGTVYGAADFCLIKLDGQGNIIWQKIYGGSDNDMPFTAESTLDNGFIIAGYSASQDAYVLGNHGSYDYWIIKVDSLGDLQWQKCFGGSSVDKATSVKQTNDGGFIIAGYSYSNDGDLTISYGNRDLWIVKTDSVGNLIWQKSYGGSNDDEPKCIVLTNDDGYIISGFSGSIDGDVIGNHGAYDSWIIKIDSIGNLQWQKCLGGSNNERAETILQLTDKGYFIAGPSNSYDGDVTDNFGIYDLWVSKLDSTGNIVWEKSFGGTDSDATYKTSSTQLSDGGFIIAGSTQSNDGDIFGHFGTGNTDFWIIKIDSIGNLIWQKCLGGYLTDYANSFQITSDEGYILAGASDSNNGNVSTNYGMKDFWVVKISESNLNNNDNLFFNSTNFYPNPSNNYITIENSKCVSIYDLTGRLKFYRNNINSFENIDISFLSNGIYCIEIDGRMDKLIKN